MTCVYYIIDKEKTDSVLCSQNTTYNDLNTTNNYDIQSCETPRKQNDSIPTTYPPKKLCATYWVHASELL